MAYWKNPDDSMLSSKTTIRLYKDFINQYFLDEKNRHFSPAEYEYLLAAIEDGGINPSSFLVCQVLDAISSLPKEHDVFAKIVEKLKMRIRDKGVVITSRCVYPSLAKEILNMKRISDGKGSVSEYSPRIINGIYPNGSEVIKSQLNYTNNLTGTEYVISIGIQQKLIDDLENLAVSNTSFCLVIPPQISSSFEEKISKITKRFLNEKEYEYLSISDNPDEKDKAMRLLVREPIYYWQD